MRPPKRPPCPRVEDEVVELDPVWLGPSAVSLSVCLCLTDVSFYAAVPFEDGCLFLCEKRKPGCICVLPKEKGCVLGRRCEVYIRSCYVLLTSLGHAQGSSSSRL